MQTLEQSLPTAQKIHQKQKLYMRHLTSTPAVRVIAATEPNTCTQYVRHHHLAYI